MRKITKEYLQREYYKKTNTQLCKELGVTKPTLIQMVDKAGIKRKGKGFHRKYEVV